MNKWMKLSLIGLSLGVLTAPIAQAQNKADIYRWVNYQELSDYDKTQFNPDLLTDLKAALESQGTKDFDSFRFEERLKKLDENTMTAPITVIAGATPDKKVFIKGLLTTSAQMKFINFRAEEQIPLSKMKFHVEVGLMQLKALLTDDEHQVHILYPVSGPGFDEGFTPRSQGNTIFLHPMIHGALERSKAEAHRTNPEYYKNRPFIRIIPDGQQWSLFAFHTSPWTDELERGFVSAGCMRLKNNDLFELYELVKNGGDANIPVQIKYELAESDDHPYPKMMDQYERVIRSHMKEGRMVFNTGRVFINKDKNEPTIAELLQKIDRYQGFWPDNSGVKAYKSSQVEGQ